MSKRLEFPPDFVWGAATSAYQIEGALREDGRGPSIWDVFASDPSNIDDGDDGSVACDHYNRWRDDIQLMKEIGLQSYRFSIAWPRILPAGFGEVNQAGIDWYSRLVDELLEAGIEPAATLYHWDLPQALEDAGGWPERQTIDPFLEYTDVITRALGDRVSMWITHNEPSIVAWLGYLEGYHAPGRESWTAALESMHHLLLSHGQALPVIRGNVSGARVGPAMQLVPGEPASSSEADRRAWRFFDFMWNRWYHDPVTGKGYPTEMLDMLVENGDLDTNDLWFVEPGDMETIASPIDFVGVNYYSRAVIRSEAIPEEDNAPREVFVDEHKTDMNWEVRPESMVRGLKWLNDEYGGIDIYITENGAAYATGPSADGKVHDELRTAYFDGHLRAAHDVIQQGIPLRGYYAWSLLDNFEWAHGMTKRFGLIWVDYETLERTIKESARWYGDVIRHNGLTQSPAGES